MDARDCYGNGQKRTDAGNGYSAIDQDGYKGKEAFGRRVTTYRRWMPKILNELGLAHPKSKDADGKERLPKGSLFLCASFNKKCATFPIRAKTKKAA
jgi:hypothetical protein